jgi:hypothetical protein
MSHVTRDRRKATIGWAVLVGLALAVGAFAVPSACFATTHNARLLHIGPDGLRSYNAWQKKSTTIVHGLFGSWNYPVMSPNNVSVVSLVSSRSDRAYYGNQYASIVATSATPFELTIPDSDGEVGMTFFLGWLDDYRAVFQQSDPNVEYGDDVTLVRDTRDPGVWSYYDGAVTYPSTHRKKTAGDAKYSVQVSKSQVMTIKSRSSHKVVAHFKVPGSGNGKSATAWYYADASISPDHTFIAYQLWRTPNNDSVVDWRTYVCTIHGKGARSLKNGDGGFVWK